MKLLVICPSFAPENSPRAFRWTPLVESLRARGHAVDVICRPHVAAVEAPDLFRVPASWLVRPQSAASAKGGATRSWKRPLVDVARWAWRAVRWPDSDCGLIGPATRLAAQLHKERGYDALVTVSHPFSGHVIGLRLKQQFPDWPWIVDVGDPFATLTASPPNNFRLYGRKNFRTEAAVMQMADAASLTTISAVRSYTQDFGISPQRMRVIPPLYSLPTVKPSEVSSVLPPWERDTAALRLVFIGRLYRTIRSPQSLLSMFREALINSPTDRPWQLHFLGDVQECARDFDAVRELIGQSIFLHGEIDRKRADAARLAADVLVNIGNATPHQLPSKLVEYVASGKPVLNVVRHDDDTSRQILDDYPRTLTINPERTPETAAATLSQFLTQPPAELSEAALDQLCRPYTLPAVTDAYESLIEEAINVSRSVLPFTPTRRVA